MSILRASSEQLATCAAFLEEQANTSELAFGEPTQGDIEWIGTLRSGAAFINRELARRKS